MNLQNYDRGHVIGDSLSAGFGAGTAPLPLGIGRVIEARFVGGRPTMPNAANGYARAASFKAPVWTIDAVAGRAAVTIAPTMATLMAVFSGVYTFALVQLGINDADLVHASLSTIPLVAAAQLTIVDDLHTRLSLPYSRILWAGPYAHDSGDLNVEIAAIDVVYAANAVLRGFEYCQLSDISNGGGNTVADGTHLTPQGATVLGTRIAQRLVN